MSQSRFNPESMTVAEAQKFDADIAAAIAEVSGRLRKLATAQAENNATVRQTEVALQQKLADAEAQFGTSDPDKLQDALVGAGNAALQHCEDTRQMVASFEEAYRTAATGFGASHG